MIALYTLRKQFANRIARSKRHAVLDNATPGARLARDETELLRNDMVFGFCIETRFSVGQVTPRECRVRVHTRVIPCRRTTFLDF